MHVTQVTVKYVCLLFAVALVVTLSAFWNWLQDDISEHLAGNVALQSRRESRTEVDCSSALQHGLHEHVTPTTLKNIFGGCANITDMSRDTFNSVFGIKTFKDVVCQPREITFLKTRKPKFALASFPGSGNTWTRHLLEQLTGIWTGSVYTDPKLSRVFLGEKLCPNSNKTYIVKSHEWSSNINYRKRYCIKTDPEDYDDAVRHFDSAIYLLRNPYDAILAEFNRKHGGHMAEPKRTLLMEDTKGWHNFVSAKAVRWRKKAEFWLTEYDGPVHILLYEHLKSSPAYELYLLSVFLETPVSYQTLWCTMARGGGQFRREKPDWLTRSNVYADDMQREVDSQIDAVESMLGSKHMPHLPYRDDT